MTAITTDDLKKLFAALAEVMAHEKDRLCALDGVIGDADHGIAMELGFSAAAKAVDTLDPENADPTVIFNTAAKSFLNAVGASSGPLYATAFMRAGAAVKGKATLDEADMASAFQAMAAGIRDRGKAEPGEKTMVDAWLPAATACAQAMAEGRGLNASLAAASDAARKGADATKNMIATKGRSARLGDRVRGHVDPGAESAAVIIGTIAAMLGNNV